MKTLEERKKLLCKSMIKSPYGWMAKGHDIVLRVEGEVFLFPAPTFIGKTRKEALDNLYKGLVEKGMHDSHKYETKNN